MPGSVDPRPALVCPAMSARWGEAVRGALARSWASRVGIAIASDRNEAVTVWLSGVRAPGE